MAIQVTFEGFVNELKTFDWGTVVVVAHNQRAKNAAGEWETVGKDYIDVTLPEGSKITEGDLVTVTGTLKTSGYSKKDGSIGVSLKVRAQDIEKISRNPKPAEDLPF